MVVFPLVPVTTVTFTPRDNSFKISLSIFNAILPGRFVPPRPIRRRTALDVLQASTANLVLIPIIFSFSLVISFLL